MQKSVNSVITERALQASMQNLLLLQGRWSFASLQSIQHRLLWFIFEQDMNIPLELRWATFAMLCPTDQSTVPAPGSFRGPSWRSSCPRSCSASSCWSQAAWLCASSWTVRHPARPGTVHPRPRCLPGSAIESKRAGMGRGRGVSGEKQKRTTQMYLPAARGVLQCSPPWFECAVVCVSSL